MAHARKYDAENTSDMFRPNSRWFASDAVKDWDKKAHQSVWGSEERPPDPKAYIVRQVMNDYLIETHREVLSKFYFEGKSINEIAVERRATKASVSQMLRRAEANFKKALLEHAEEYQEVPSEEL